MELFFTAGAEGTLNGNSNGQVGDEHKATPPPGGGEGAAKSTAWHHTRKMIYVKSKGGFWPVPEPFWLDTHTVTLVGGSHMTSHDSHVTG